MGLFEQQFARDERQWAAKGKGKAKSADGDFSTRAISFRPADVPDGYTYAYREARVISVPVLINSLGNMFTAADLWRFYKSLPLLVVRRTHAWSSDVRPAAAKLLSKEYGYYGHRG